MKYYVYLSENKIQMLYSQTATAAKGPREATLGFDVKLLKASVKSGPGVPDSSFAKLRAVLEELGKIDLVGEVHDPKPYIRGSLPLVWAGYGMSFPKDEPITFWGYCSDEIALGMAGSSYHVLGNQRDGSAHSHSLTPAILAWFRENLGEPIPPEEEEESRYAIYARAEDRKLEEFDIANATWLAATQMHGYKTSFEFVAKVLHRSHWPEGFRHSSHKTIILASPLYVSMDE